MYVLTTWCISKTSVSHNNTLYFLINRFLIVCVLPHDTTKRSVGVAAHHFKLDEHTHHWTIATLLDGSSGTSDKGPTEIGVTSLQRTIVAAPC